MKSMHRMISIECFEFVKLTSQPHFPDEFKAEKAEKELSYPAQRKVASALLMMVDNETMLYHFIHKGGVDALFKLVRDSKNTSI